MGLCGRGTEGPVSFHLNPRKRISIVPQDSPGMRLPSSHAGAVFMCGGNPNPTENNRGKQGRSICTLAIHLLGTGTQTPEKNRQRWPFSSPLTGRLRVLPDAVSILLSAGQVARIQRPKRRVAAPQVERLARQRKRPLPGDWGRPPTSRFSIYSPGQNRKVCTTLHCLPLLRTVKMEVRIIPIRRIKPVRQNGVYVLIFLIKQPPNSENKTNNGYAAKNINNWHKTVLLNIP